MKIIEKWFTLTFANKKNLDEMEMEFGDFTSKTQLLKAWRKESKFYAEKVHPLQWQVEVYERQATIAGDKCVALLSLPDFKKLTKRDLKKNQRTIGLWEMGGKP